MPLALRPPIEPQLARSASQLPTGERWAYEPKYDGFRCIAFVDGDRLTLQSRGGRPLDRYFPELTFPAGRYVLDGEIVVESADGREDFDALQQRIHPAASRIALLAERTPARYIAFDLLAREEEVLLGLPFAQRRALLEALPLTVTPLTRAPADAERWLHDGEGVVAKDLAAPYRPGQRAGMVKVKRVRTLDAVLAGYRPGKEAGTVGSLMLGLYDGRGELRVVGHCSGLRAGQRRALLAKLKPYETGRRGRGEPSRWRSERELEWIELRPELVVEVAYDHASGGRIRHGTRILRWREDKAPEECRLEQLT